MLMQTRRTTLAVLATLALLAAGADTLTAWGVRAHTWINRVAVRTIPDDGPVFLKPHEDWIAYLSTIPDTWRRPSEPFLKMLEDPNHGWFKEQFSFMQDIPRSRYGFVLRLYDEQRRLAAAGDPAASLTNVRWTGTMPYAAVEGYERMLAGMRRYREERQRGVDTQFVEREIAFYMGWTGHYTGDGAQPLHDTVHHDGWQGANPRQYTTNPRVHGLFETQYVDLMGLEARDFQADVRPARVLDDPFRAILAHLDDAGTFTEQVYRLEQQGALKDPAHAQARALVIRQAARGAELLRDLAHTAWVRSGEPPQNDPAGNPIVPAHPGYDPQTGSAPAHVPVATPRRPDGPVAQRGPASAGAQAAGDRPEPLVFADAVVGKNFYLFELIARSAEARAALAGQPELSAMLRQRVAALRGAVAACTNDVPCLLDRVRWTTPDVDTVARALTASVRTAPPMALVAGQLRRSGMAERHAALSDEALVAETWRESAAGVNRLLDVYGLGKAPLYPAIDAVTYPADSVAYRNAVMLAVQVASDEGGSAGHASVFGPALAVARRLLAINRRDEAGRFEPLHLGENQRAVRHVASVDWARYPYAAIIVPGAGTDRVEMPLSPAGLLRTELAAQRYHAGQAPFLIVSGGYVHPNQTPHNEALEMKRALVERFGVPPEAVLIEPHARHTTTNLRNASRLVLRHGFPEDRPLLITTDAQQSAYITGTVFAERCLKEMGYQPGTLGRRLSPFDVEFRPSRLSLHADSRDALDP